MASWVEDAVLHLITSRGATIASNMAYPWETWALLEITYKLATTVPNSTVSRSQPCYLDDSQPADIMLSYTDEQGTRLCETLELKCWHDGRDRNEFISLVRADIDKILTTTNRVGICAWAMVLVADVAVKQEMKVAMEGKRRHNDRGEYIDQVAEKDFALNGGATIYLLSFLMPINIPD